jgi:hypothetical protein
VELLEDVMVLSQMVSTEKTKVKRTEKEKAE